jgi:hypothetical protein
VNNTRAMPTNMTGRLPVAHVCVAGSDKVGSSAERPEPAAVPDSPGVRAWGTREHPPCVPLWTRDLPDRGQPALPAQDAAVTGVS